jgi:chemotaxis signal transduction protein
VTANRTLPRLTALAPEDAAWTGFELDGKVFALPYRCVEQVLPARPVTKLPFAPPAVEGVASISGDVVPVLALRALLSPGQSPPARRSPDFIVIRVAGRRFVLRVDRVLFIADPLASAAPPAETADSVVEAVADWSGLPVTCLASDRLGIDALQPLSPPRGAAGPTADYRTAPAETDAAEAGAVLAVHAGGVSYGLRAAAVVELLEEVALTRLPLVPAALLGIAVLRGNPLLTFSLAGLLGRDAVTAPGAYVVANLGGSRFVLAVDAIDGLRRSSASPGDPSGASAAPVIVDLKTLIAPQWLVLTAAMSGTVAPAPIADRHRQRFLCVSLGSRFCALPLASVERILPPRAPIRLPAGALAGVDGAVEFDGRVIPVTDGWRWLSLQDGGPVAAHIVLHQDGERRVLAVNAVQRIVTIAREDILTTADQDQRIAGFGRANGRTVAILSTAALISTGGPA